MRSLAHPWSVDACFNFLSLSSQHGLWWAASRLDFGCYHLDNCVGCAAPSASGAKETSLHLVLSRSFHHLIGTSPVLREKVVEPNTGKHSFLV